MKKLNEIQQKLIAPKNQHNKFGNYNYRSAEDILEAVKPLLGGLILTITDEIVLVGERYYIKATVSIADDNGECMAVSAFARESLDKKGMDTAQITGAASSYARKYALNGLFCIDDTKDPDHSNNGERKTQSQVPKKNVKIMNEVYKKLAEHLPTGVEINKKKVDAIFLGRGGKFPDDLKKAGVAASWLISLKQEESWTKKPAQKTPPAKDKKDKSGLNAKDKKMLAEAFELYCKTNKAPNGWAIDKTLWWDKARRISLPKNKEDLDLYNAQISIRSVIKEIKPE